MSPASRDRIIAIIVLVLAGSLLLAYWLYRRCRPGKKKPPKSHNNWFGQIDYYSRDDKIYAVTTTITGGIESSDSMSWDSSVDSNESGQGHQRSALGEGEILVTTTLAQHTDCSHDHGLDSVTTVGRGAPQMFCFELLFGLRPHSHGVTPANPRTIERPPGYLDVENWIRQRAYL